MTNCFTNEELLKKYPNVRKFELQALRENLEAIQEEYGTNLELYKEAANKELNDYNYAKVILAKADLNSVIKTRNNIEHISQQGFRGNPVEGMLSLWEGTTRNVKNKHANVDSIYHTTKVDNTQDFLSSLSDKGVLEIMQRDELHEDIIKIHENRKWPDADFKPHPVAQEIYDTISKANHKSLIDMQTAGSSILKDPDYIFNNGIDTHVVFADEIGWAAAARDAYDWDKILSTDFAKASKASRIKETKEIFKKFKMTNAERLEAAKTYPKGKFLLSQGKKKEAMEFADAQTRKQISAQIKLIKLSELQKSDIIDKVIDDRLQGMLASSVHSASLMGGRHTWKFKKGKMFEYNKKWGKGGNLLTSVVHSIDVAAKKTAVTKVFGNNFRKNHEILKEHIRKIYPDKVGGSSFDEGLAKVDKAMNLYTGVGNIPQKGIGQFAYEAVVAGNKISAMQMLNWTGMTSTMDLANMFVHSVTQEGLKMNTFTRPIKNLLLATFARDRKVIADLTKTAIDTQLREMLEVGVVGPKAGYLSKFMGWQMIANGTRAVTNVMREGYSKHMMETLEGLITRHRGTHLYNQTMGALGLSEPDIDLLLKLRQSTGQRFFVSNSLKDADIPEVRRQDLQMKLNSYYYNGINSGSPLGGAKEQRMLRKDRPQDSIARVTWEAISLFKQTLLKSGNTFAEMVRASSSTGTVNPIEMYKNSDMNPIKNAAILITAAGVVGYTKSVLQDEAEELLTGKIKRKKTLIAEVASSISASGVLGLPGDIVLSLPGSEGRYSSGLAPLASQSVKVYQAIAAGNKDAATRAKETFNLMMPGRNLWATKAIEHYLFDEFNRATKSSGGF